MDYFPQKDVYVPGGNSLNQALYYKLGGHQSAFVGPLGTDDWGDQIFELCQGEGLDMSCCSRIDGKTASNQIINDEAGERYGVEGAWNGGVYEEFVLNESDWEKLKQFDMWATHANGPCYLQALKRKSPGQFMSVDFLDMKDYELLEESLKIITVAFFGGTTDMAPDLARIASKYTVPVVLTLGAEGSIAYWGEKTYHQPALPLENVIDTTGCGDAFQAGFFACFTETQDISASLLAGAELGREAAGHQGGVPRYSNR